MKTQYNFSPGPSVLPEPVRQHIQSEWNSYSGLPCSIAEVSHRSRYFQEILIDCKKRLRTLLNIPKNYHILFLHGGASLQYTMIPMNFLEKKAAYIDTGVWSQKAINSALFHGEVQIVATSKNKNYSYVPSWSDKDIEPHNSYLHITENNTIYGTEYHNILHSHHKIIADMTSNIMSKEIEVEKYAMIYAGAQKNLGISGLAVAIVRQDLLEISTKKKIPPLLHYITYHKFDSMFNTPNTFAIYVMNLVLKWISKQGGIINIEKENYKKQKLLYSVIDGTTFYNSAVEQNSRSFMNIVFRLNNENLETLFLEKAEERGLLFLKGHRLVGGIRVSIYNAMTYKGVEVLAHFMKDFEKEYG